MHVTDQWKTEMSTLEVLLPGKEWKLTNLPGKQGWKTSRPTTVWSIWHHVASTTALYRSIFEIIWHPQLSDPSGIIWHPQLCTATHHHHHHTWLYWTLHSNQQQHSDASGSEKHHHIELKMICNTFLHRKHLLQNKLHITQVVPQKQNNEEHLPHELQLTPLISISPWSARLVAKGLAIPERQTITIHYKETVTQETVTQETVTIAPGSE